MWWKDTKVFSTHETKFFRIESTWRLSWTETLIMKGQLLFCSSEPFRPHPLRSSPSSAADRHAQRLHTRRWWLWFSSQLLLSPGKGDRIHLSEWDCGWPASCLPLRGSETLAGRLERSSGETCEAPAGRRRTQREEGRNLQTVSGFSVEQTRLALSGARCRRVNEVDAALLHLEGRTHGRGWR